MKISKIILILAVLSLILVSGCKKAAQEQVYQPKQEEKLIISLEKTVASGVNEKYDIYSSGRYVVTLTNKNKEETKKENALQEYDLNYLKSLFNSKEFKSIPPYMEGAGGNCPTVLLRISSDDQDKTVRAESCANTPDAFNKVVDEIEKLK